MQKEIKNYLPVNEHMNPEVTAWSHHKAPWRVYVAYKDLQQPQQILSEDTATEKYLTSKGLWAHEAEIPKHAFREGKGTVWGPTKPSTARRSTWCASFLKPEVLPWHRFNIQLKFLGTKPKRKPEHDSLCHLHGIWAWVLIASVISLLKNIFIFKSIYWL